jgi:hypothetical protein
MVRAAHTPNGMSRSSHRNQLPMPRTVPLQLAPLQAGWAKLAELRRHMEAFAASGKWTVAWMSQVTSLPARVPVWRQSSGGTRALRSAGRGCQGNVVRGLR